MQTDAQVVVDLRSTRSGSSIAIASILFGTSSRQYCDKYPILRTHQNITSCYLPKAFSLQTENTVLQLILSNHIRTYTYTYTDTHTHTYTHTYTYTYTYT